MRSTSILCLFALGSPLLFGACAEISNGINGYQAYRTLPVCQKARAKCQEYESMGGYTESLKARELQSDCASYRQVCDNQIRQSTP